MNTELARSLIDGCLTGFKRMHEVCALRDVALIPIFLPETDKELKPQNDFINRRIFNEFLIHLRYTASG